MMFTLLPLLAMIPTGIYFYFFLKRIVSFFIKTTNIPMKIILIILTLCFVMPTMHIWGVWTVVVYYLLSFCIVVDILVWVFKKTKHQNVLLEKIYQLGIIPILCLILTLSYGYFHMKDVHVQKYTIHTQKNINKNYKIVLITDLHFGNTMNNDELKAYCQEISLEKPDIVLLGGDIVDEKTSHQDMTDVFDILGDIENQYGIYYVYGNHDQALYSSHPAFTIEELSQTIIANDIQILNDEKIQIQSEFTLIGRDDRSHGQRETTQDLLKNVNQNHFIMILDHQPVDLVENDQLGIDLQLSGHTHGGQMFPVGLVSDVVGFGEMNYGYQALEHMQVIVSSGIAGWGYPLRTGSQSEYVIVNIENVS